MPIPDFQSIMLPFLKTVSDGDVYSNSVINERLAVFFKLTEEELNELLPSGVAKIFYNRVAWAKTYLKTSGLIESFNRGQFKITELGKTVLEKKPIYLNLRLLKELPSFLEGKSDPKTNNSGIEPLDSSDIKETPEEILESSYLNIRKNLSQELLLKIKSCKPSFFETLVVELLVKMGYGGTMKEAGKSIGKSGDEGIDGVIKEDKLGLDIIYIQAKRWEGVVGRPEIHKFIGALAGQGAKKGVFITTSRFTNEAKDYQPKNETKIVLIDGEQLAQLMIDYNLGVTKQQTYEIKRIDTDYFEEE